MSPLYYARNAVIYVLLIGSLMAIVLGVQATVRDRKASTVDLVLSDRSPPPPGCWVSSPDSRWCSRR